MRCLSSYLRIGRVVAKECVRRVCVLEAENIPKLCVLLLVSRLLWCVVLEGLQFARRHGYLNRVVTWPQQSCRYIIFMESSAKEMQDEG